MKKILFVFFVFGSILAASSCEYDDSNDIDVLTPLDSISAGKN